MSTTIKVAKYRLPTFNLHYFLLGKQLSTARVLVMQEPDHRREAIQKPRKFYWYFHGQMEPAEATLFCSCQGCSNRAGTRTKEPWSVYVWSMSSWVWAWTRPHPSRALQLNVLRSRTFFPYTEGRDGAEWARQGRRPGLSPLRELHCAKRAATAYRLSLGIGLRRRGHDPGFSRPYHSGSGSPPQCCGPQTRTKGLPS